ncbi:zinc finger protein 622 [Drosophila grimshawi]|uniref:GH12142 n=1 Tax=Drosophila grimshawi TaxID=7222 RepID=B4JK00_DROGR|nr:zinc finger protein 622 [Drosophila grimshawi]EDV99902.1 GH12142 [Drosophila grimshawi]
MSQFTCINCDARFANAQIQRDHYKTDWHRYNLKRRVAQLPPVTAEEFQQRVLSARSATETAIEEQQMSIYCTACRKQFGTQKAHDNHLNSKKHKEALIRFEQQLKQQSESQSETETAVCIRSIVEPRPHPALAAAASGKGRLAFAERAMQIDADEAIGDDDDFEDIEEEEIDSDEWDKIAENPLTERDCLFCTQQSDDLVENLKHMSLTHSFFIPDTDYCTDIEGLLYYLGEKVANYFICLWCNDRGKTFYSLDAVRKHMVDKGHCQMLHEGVALAEYAEYYDYSASYPDNKEGMDIDEEIVPDLLDGDEYQLVLPSGAVIGHRSLLRYYKQRLHPERAVALKKSDRKLHRVLSEYRALGWTQTQQQAAARKARDIHLMKRVQSKWQMQLGTKANKLQKHYRAQVLI